MDDPAWLQGKTLLVVDACSEKKSFVFKALHELGIHLICLYTYEAEWIKEYVDEWIVADVYDYNKALEWVGKYMWSWKNTIDWVITYREDAVILTSMIVDKLWILGIHFDQASKLKNKYLLRQMYGSEDYNKSIKIYSKEDIDIIDSHIWSYPIVMKPVFGADSSNVVKVNSKEEALYHYTLIQNKIHDDVNLRDWFEILAEKYIAGQEVDMDIVMQDGIMKFFSITDNDPTTEPYFLESWQNTPTRLSIDAQEKLQALALKIISDVGISDACLHFEAKYTWSWAEIIETNLRMWWARVHSFVYNARWVDLVVESVKVALWISTFINKPSHPLAYLVGKHLLPERSWIITSIHVPQEVYDDPRILEVKILTQVWQEIFTPPDGFGDHGWITVKWDSPEQADEALVRLKNLCNIVVE